MRFVMIGLILALLGLQCKLWFGDASVLQWVKLEKKKKTQAAQNETLEAQNRVIEAHVMELKTGVDALEEQARNELGMIKQGEIYYQLVD